MAGHSKWSNVQYRKGRQDAAVAEVRHAFTKHGGNLGAEDAARCIRLLETLQDLDDVQDVYSNAEFPDDLAA